MCSVMLDVSTKFLDVSFQADYCKFYILRVLIKNSLIKILRYRRISIVEAPNQSSYFTTGW